RNRCWHTDSQVRLQCAPEHWRRLARCLGRKLGPLGQRHGSWRHLSRSGAARWIAESRDDWPEAGIPAQERRSVQRRNVPYGVLRSIRSAKRQKFLGVMEGYTRVNIERRK